VDYAFAPGGSSYDEDMHRLLARRPGTTLVTPKQTGKPTIAAFLNYLANTAAVAKPVGDLVIASHGDDAGWMKIALDNPANTNADYEEVERVDNAGTINVPSALINTAAGAPPMTIHIRGCRIGQAKPFMDLLKHAFGGKATLTAPLFFHLLRTETAEGSFEYLGYSFGFPSPTELADRDAVVQAFKDHKLKFLDGTTPVPDERWEDWIPPSVAVAHRQRPVFADLGQTIGSLGKKLKVRNEFRHDVEPTGFVLDTIASDPGSDAARIQTLKTFLSSKDPRYMPSHKYPVYVRLGYASGNDFVDGYVWQFVYDAGKSTLTCSGTRHFYTVIVPVTDLATGQLLFNFYPKSGSSVAAVTKLPDTDPHLFLTV
jgi:hypothetical protein